MFAIFHCHQCGQKLALELPPLWLDEWPRCCGLEVLLWSVQA